MEIKGDTVNFSSGREIYANHGIIGINADLFVFQGYDDALYDDHFTLEERTELADFMISLWNDYKKGGK